MKTPNRYLALGALLFAAAAWGLLGTASAQEGASANGYHAFANKDGQSIEAQIVSVSPDWKTMKIRRRDGNEFDMAINVLTLDDQQFVKAWIKANPMSATVTYELDVTMEKKEETSERKRGEYYRFSTKDVSYQVSVRNKTSEPLIGASLEYVLLLEEAIRITRSASGAPESYSRSSDPRPRLVKGVEKLPDSLAFNYAHEFFTKVAKIEEVLGDGNYKYGEDDAIGMMVRVTDSQGAVIGVYRSGDSRMRNVTWESLMGMSTDDDSSSSSRASSSSSTPTPVSSDAPEGIDARELTEWPAALQKGDMVASGVVPDLSGKPIYITATIDIDENDPDGVILAHGGGQKGYVLFVHEGKLHFWVKRYWNYEDTVRSVEISLAGLPTRDFELSAEYIAERLVLYVNGQRRKTAESFDYFESPPKEGLSVGWDGGSTVGPPAANVAFPGLVQDVRIKYGL